MLYIIGSNPMGPLKVGISKDPEVRLKQLQTACPTKLVIYATAEVSQLWYGSGYLELTDREAEARIHEYLQHYRLEGEWFDADLYVVTEGAIEGSAIEARGYVGDFEPDWEMTSEGSVGLELALAAD